MNADPGASPRQRSRWALPARFRELADLTHGSFRFSSEDRTMLPVTSIPSPPRLWLLLAGICALFMRLRSLSPCLVAARFRDVAHPQ
jgi:hypothetical protein